MGSGSEGVAQQGLARKRATSITFRQTLQSGHVTMGSVATLMLMLSDRRIQIPFIAALFLIMEVQSSVIKLLSLDCLVAIVLFCFLNHNYDFLNELLTNKQTRSSV